jgi:hypothetical protein
MGTTAYQDHRHGRLCDVFRPDSTDDVFCVCAVYDAPAESSNNLGNKDILGPGPDVHELLYFSSIASKV